MTRRPAVLQTAKANRQRGASAAGSSKQRTTLPAAPHNPYEAVLDVDVLNLSPDCVKIIGLDGRLRHMNVAGCAALGLDAGKIAGREWLKLLPEPVHKAGRLALCHAAAGQNNRFFGLSQNSETGLRHWDNMLTPLVNASGNVEEILCVSRDVTEQKLSDGHASRKLLEADRLSRRVLSLLRASAISLENDSIATLFEDLEHFLAPVAWARDPCSAPTTDESGPQRRSSSKAIGNGTTCRFAQANIRQSISRVKLTDKERECLIWVSRGKTAWETAMITGRSRRTIEFHLANATKKLNAANKIQAAILASRHGLI